MRRKNVLIRSGRERGHDMHSPFLAGSFVGHALSDGGDAVAQGSARQRSLCITERLGQWLWRFGACHKERREKEE